MRFLLIIVILIFLLCWGCKSKKETNYIELPFKVITPGYFDISDIPDSSYFIEVITWVKTNLHTIEIRVRDSVQPDAYQYFNINGRYSYSNKHYKVEDTIVSLSSDGISKFIFKNGNLVWGLDQINTERIRKYRYKGDTLIETQFQKKSDADNMSLQFENKYLFSKDKRMLYSTGMFQNTFVYHYNSNNQIIKIDEMGNNNLPVGYKGIEYLNNLIVATSYLLGKVEETDSAYKYYATEFDSVYLDNKGRISKKVNIPIGWIAKTKYYFYDSLEHGTVSKISPEILDLIKSVNRKPK